MKYILLLILLVTFTFTKSNNEEIQPTVTTRVSSNQNSSNRQQNSQSDFLSNLEAKLLELNKKLPFDLPVKQFIQILRTKQAIHRFIGILIALAPLLAKIPVILLILKRKRTSQKFILIYGEILLNIFMISFNLHQKNPFWKYGEHIISLIANVVILFSTFIFPNKKRQQTAFRLGTLVLIVIITLFYLERVPSIVQELCPYMGLLAITYGKIYQITGTEAGKKIGNLKIRVVQIGAAVNLFRLISSLFAGEHDGRPHLVNGLQLIMNIYLIYLCKFKLKAAKQIKKAEKLAKIEKQQKQTKKQTKISDENQQQSSEEEDSSNKKKQ